MLTRWLTITSLLAASANLGSADSARGSVTVTPTCRVKGEPEEELVLGCGDGKYAGVVQFWHTPFGDLQTSALHTELDPVFLHHNGSLLIPSCSILHSGLYYCVLHHAEGSTLWPYELHVGQHLQNKERNNQDASCSVRRLRRSIERQSPAGVSKGLFAGAVVASVLLTFVVGFSAGALTRTHVLRCLRGVTMRLKLPKKRHRQTNTPDHSSQVTMATLPPMYNQSSEDEVMHDSPTCGTPETTASVTTPSPPAKPQRSFRHKREEEPEAAAYLEGCDYKQEENIEGEEVPEKGVKKMKERSDEEVMDEKETTELSFHLFEDEGIQTEDNCRDEKDGGESREERKEEAAGEQESRSMEVVKQVENDAELITEEVKETEKCEELEQRFTESEDKSSRNETMKDSIAEEKMSSSAPRRSSRVIRLYQYDEDGQRYSHLPEPGCADPEPAARLKRRSLSLTRLNAIMAAASAGPMDEEETGGQQSEGPQHFHMEI